MKKRDKEITRTNVTVKAFYNYCKKELKAKGFDMEAYITFEEFINPSYKTNNTYRDSENHNVEICQTLPYDHHLFYRNTYNFIMEFNFDNEKTGSGYLYICEFEEDEKEMEEIMKEAEEAEETEGYEWLEKIYEIEENKGEIIDCLAEADKEAMTNRATEVNVIIDHKGKPYKTYNNAGSGFLPESVWKGLHFHLKTFCYQNEDPEDWTDEAIEYMVMSASLKEEELILEQPEDERLKFIKEKLPHIYYNFEKELIDCMSEYGLREGGYEEIINLKLKEMSY